MFLPFNTLEYANQLKSSGISAKEAEAHANAMANAMSSLIENHLATKQDIEMIHLATKQDIEMLRTATKQDIEMLRTATKQDIEIIHKDIATIHKDIATIHKDMESFQSSFATKQEMNTKFAQLELKLTKRMGLITAGGVSILVSLMVFLHIH